MDKTDKKKEENPCLEIPSEFAISMRKEMMMENLMKGRKTAPTTSKLEASSILGKVKAFLPQMKSANEQLETMDKESFLIDSVPAEGEAYIEMEREKRKRHLQSKKHCLEDGKHAHHEPDEAGMLARKGRGDAKNLAKKQTKIQVQEVYDTMINALPVDFPNLATYSDSEDSGKGVLDSDTDSEDEAEEATTGVKPEISLRTEQKSGSKTPLVELMEPDKYT